MLYNQFINALKDDLNTPLAITIMHKITKRVFQERHKGNALRAEEFSKVLRECGLLLGIFSEEELERRKNHERA